MPYSTPSIGRPGHRRSFSTDQGPGAFASLGALPRRTPALQAKFHLKDEDDTSGSEDDDQDLSHNSHVPPPLKLKIHHQQRVPFPKSSPLSPIPQLTLSSPPPVRPTPSRTSSTPILLSNGKPLKSSLKSSNSSPSIYNAHSQNPISHLRARSAPATPNLDILSSPPQSPVSTPKNVHFPQSSSDLESVRVFNRSAKPASLLTRGDETETETEGESSASASGGWTLGGFVNSTFSRGFPFPRIPPPVPSPLNPARNVEEHQYVLELTHPVPINNPDPYGNVYLEALSLSSAAVPPETGEHTLVAPMASTALYLHGTLLLRNIAFEKHASVRFTLDEWDTTSEVIAKYSSSLSSPPPFLLPRTLGDLLVNDIPTSFDRFVFSIRLSDYLPHGLRPKDEDIPLLKKKLYLAIRYAVPGQGEWWDNCQGKNWGVGFRLEKKEEEVQTPKEEDKSRERSLSAPAIVANGPSSTFLLPSWSSPPNPVHPTAPTNNLSSPNTTPPACPPLHERGFSEPLPSPPSHSPQHKALEVATNARLSRFRLMNYAAPKPRSNSASSSLLPAMEKQEDKDADTTPTQRPVALSSEKTEEGQVPFPSTESFPFPSSSPQPAIMSKSLDRLHWPWGQKASLAEAVLTTDSPSLSRSPSPPSAPAEMKDEVVDSSSPPPSTIRRWSPPPSPSILRHLKLDLDVPQLERSRSSSMSSEDSDSLADILSPDLPTLPVHVRVDSNSSSPGSNPMESDLLYKAFVQKWCFGGVDGPPHSGTPHHRARGAHSYSHRHHSGVEGSLSGEGMGIEA